MSKLLLAAQHPAAVGAILSYKGGLDAAGGHVRTAEPDRVRKAVVVAHTTIERIAAAGGRPTDHHTAAGDVVHVGRRGAVAVHILHLARDEYLWRARVRERIALARGRVRLHVHGPVADIPALGAEVFHVTAHAVGIGAAVAGDAVARGL